ncbi:hypothetical protein Tco_0146452 [Tanacetum coccineum]
MTDEEGGKKKKAPPAGKSKKPAPAKQSALAKQTKHIKEKTSKPSPSKKIRKGKVMKVRKGKRSDHLVDKEDEEPQPASETQVEDDEYNLQRGIQMSLESFQAPVGRGAIREPDSGIIQKLPEVEGKGKGIISDEQATQSLFRSTKAKEEKYHGSIYISEAVYKKSGCIYWTFYAKTSANTEKSNSVADTETLNVVEEQGDEVSNMVALEERTVELDEGYARSDPGKTLESQSQPEREFMEKDQARSDLGQSHVEQVHMENPPSSSGTLSSMKNLDDAFTFDDQFLNEKSSEDEPGKAPLLSTPIIDLTPPKPVSPPIQEPIFIAKTETTTTLLPPPPPQKQSITDPVLANRISALENRSTNFEQKYMLQDKTIEALGSKVYTLENHNMYSKINKQVNEVFKEAVHTALQASLYECFRDLSEFEIKEILCDRMFESGSYRSHPDHTTLYDALELYMDRVNSKEFKEAMAKSCKRRRDDQDPPPPSLKDSDQSKKKRHDLDASALKRPPVQKSSAWKTSNIREAPTSSSKQNPASPPPIDDNPISDDMHLLESEDTGAAYLLKIKTRPDWLKPLAEEEASKTPEPDWVIPPNDLPETDNNWADALAKMY